MGNKALIQLTYDAEFSPALYMHWDGDHARDIIKETRKRMEDYSNDVEYSFARLVQVAMGDDQGHRGYGVYNTSGTLTSEDSPGDNGCFVVDIKNDWKIRNIK